MASAERDPTWGPPDPPAPPGGRMLEIYQAVRAHELTLNEARAEIGRGERAPAITLNGGAIVAFLTCSAR